MKKPLLAAAFGLTLAACTHTDTKERPETCVFEGAELEVGTSCMCDGIEGYVGCSPTPHCSACVAAENNVSDVGSMDAARDSGDGGPTDGGPTDGGADGGADVGTDVSMMSRHRGSCTTSADCADPNWECVTIPAGDPLGYHTCQPGAAQEPGCGMIQPPDNCCLHSDCNQTDPSGTCVVGPLFYCGGVQPIIANICVYDACATDGDCAADEVCVPPRVLAEPVARCVPTRCRFDADCVGGTGGECRPFFDPCNGRFSGFACTYDDSECRSNADCPADMRFCIAGADDGDTSCQDYQPPP